jgi:predicted pyridoxine 5'-phosphate oxidase superfamily flavin-nucleotide-binding protein
MDTTALPHDGGPNFVYQAAYERGRPDQLAEHDPNYALSAVGKALDKRRLSLYNRSNNNTQGRP